jgi:hypothetical protein
MHVNIKKQKKKKKVREPEDKKARGGKLTLTAADPVPR